MKKILLATAMMFAAGAACAADAQKEEFYVNAWCSEMGGQQEVRTSMNTRVDCLLDEYAVEVDFDTKWAEGLGQALHYSVMFDRPGAVLLILKNHDGQDRSNYVERLNATIAGAGLDITVFIIETKDYELR